MKILALKESTTGPRNDTGQSTFRELLIREHKARSPHHNGKLWRPALGEYVNAEYIPGSNQRWNDLDNAAIVFRNSNRPRSRYLYEVTKYAESFKEVVALEKSL